MPSLLQSASEVSQQAQLRAALAQELRKMLTLQRREQYVAVEERLERLTAQLEETPERR